jgi:hypothetical protein
MLDARNSFFARQLKKFIFWDSCWKVQADLIENAFLPSRARRGEKGGNLL